jgi:solute carrier family 25 phosphate transporter 3
MWFLRRTSLLLLYIFSCSLDSSLAANGAFSAAVSALQKLDARYFVAGGVCAATSHGLTTPMDVVKTKMQANPQVYNKGVYDATVSIIKTDGPQALLGGLGPTIVGYGIEGGMKFGVYEVLKPVFLNVFESISKKDSTAAAYICASVVAGAVASLLLCPMELTRIRIVTDPDYKGDSLMGAFRKLVKDNGILSTFSGMYAMLAKQVRYCV